MILAPKAAKLLILSQEPGAMKINGKEIVLRLDHDSAEWLASNLPDGDAYTQALWWHIYELKRIQLSGD